MAIYINQCHKNYKKQEKEKKKYSGNKNVARTQYKKVVQNDWYYNQILYLG